VVYTIPTVYRMLVEAEADTARRFDLKSLRHLASVLEPLYPDLIYGLMRIIDIPIHDTWWTAETGMITIANFPCLAIKPGYLGRPVPGLTAAVLGPDGKEPAPFTMGDFAIKQGWPAMARGVWRNEQAFSWFVRRPPWFLINDTAFMDYDGYFFHQGRSDDVIITAGGKTGFTEIEQALLEHPAVAEAGVIRVADQHGMKKIKAYVCLKAKFSQSPLLQKKIAAYLQQTLDPGLALAGIEFRDSLPRDKNGRLMRRVLKAWELGLPVGKVE
jgi:acetyl-CoA synthetase